MSANKPRQLQLPKAKSSKSFSNLRKKLIGDESPKYLPPEPINPPRLRTHSSGPMLRDKTSIARLQHRTPSKPFRLPLSPGASDDPNSVQGPRFMSMEQATDIASVHYIPSCKYNIPRAKMPTVWGVAPSRTKKRRLAPKRVSRPMRILKALRHPDRFKKKCKGAFEKYARTKMLKHLHGCTRASQTQAQAQEEQKPLENVEVQYKPLYRLKEIKRASLLFGLPKPRRPTSFASVKTTSSAVDRQRHSDASIYSRRMSTARPPTESSAEGHASHEINSEEDLSLRSSLLPYREWWSFLQSRTNPFTDNTNVRSSGISATTTTAPIHNAQEDPRSRDSLHTLFASPSSFSARTSQRFSNFLHKPPNLELTEESDIPSPPSPTSSELTITPLRFSTVQKMPEGANVSSNDPAAKTSDPKDMAKEETKEGVNVKSKDAENKDDESDENKHGSNMQRDKAFSIETSQPEKQTKKSVSPKNDTAGDTETAAQGKLDDSKSRISRSYGKKSYPGLTKGVRATPEHRSAIPVAVRKPSAGSGDTSPTDSNEGFAGGIRVLDKPSGPQHRSADEQPRSPTPEPIKQVDSESTASSWDLDDSEDEMPKPPTGFTGEHRTRLSDRLKKSSHGPTLKIAESADRIIMGTDDRFTSSIVTQRSSPARIKYVKEVKSDSPKDQNTPEDKSGPAQKEQLPVPFYRSKISLENLPKRDISNRELAVARKPLNRPSFTNIFAPSVESLREEQTPPVPKVVVSKDGNLQTSSPLAEMKTVDSATQTPGTIHQHSGGSADSASKPINKTMGPLRSHPPPPRTSSLQAVTSSNVEAGPEAPEGMPAKEHEEDHLRLQQIESSRIPDSKSNRMLDSFRNIFKHKGAVEKGRTRKEEPEVPMLSKDQSIVSVKPIDSTDEKMESVKPAPKGKAKHSMAWNKTTRNPKTSGGNSPAFVPTPSSTLSASFPTPLGRSPREDHTPSFARPTQSTRTKAAVSGSKPSSAGQEGHPRRLIQGGSAAGGSPKRAGRIGVKKSSSNQRPMISHPRLISHTSGLGNMVPVKGQENIAHIKGQESRVPAKGQENIIPGSSGIRVKKSEPMQASLKDIQSCIATLCNKVRDETTAEKREKNLRLALSLQKQLSDFHSTEKEAEEAQMLLNSKKADKDTARDTLFNYFSQVNTQLDE